MFFDWDLDMYDPVTNERAKANTSDLNEELGQVSFNPLPHMSIFGSYIQQQIKIACQKYGQMGIQLSDWVENVEKGEIARNEQFLIFRQCFQKLDVIDVSKWVSME